MTSEAGSSVKPRQEHADFLLMAYCGLVLRGYNNERSIPDPILRKVWRLGKKLAKEAK